LNIIDEEINKLAPSIYNKKHSIEIDSNTDLQRFFIKVQVEITNKNLDAASKYIQLDTDKSEELFEILTGGKLSELK